MILNGPKDITAQAQAAGWQTQGLTVTAHTVRDNVSSPYDEDCFTSSQRRAWLRGSWKYVGVIVTVKDTCGREWGASCLFGVVSGSFVYTDETDRVTGTRNIDPLTDPGHPLPDLITEALTAAQDELAKFTMPVIVAPEREA